MLNQIVYMPVEDENGNTIQLPFYERDLEKHKNITPQSYDRYAYNKIKNLKKRQKNLDNNIEKVKEISQEIGKFRIAQLANVTNIPTPSANQIAVKHKDKIEMKTVKTNKSLPLVNFIKKIVNSIENRFNKNKQSQKEVLKNN